jgi:hypothetical protein
LFEQSAYKDGKLPSGWNDDDLDDFILDGMWQMLTGAKVIDVEAEPQDNADDEAENEGVANDEGNFDRPESWIFQGWFAYRLFGPRAANNDGSTLFEVGDWVKNKRSSG